MSLVYVSACHKPHRGSISRAQKYTIKCKSPWIFGKKMQNVFSSLKKEGFVLRKSVGLTNFTVVLIKKKTWNLLHVF